MTRLFDVQTPELTIVFGRTKRRVDELARGLEARGYRAEGIHGDLSQQKRMSVLRSFKSGHLDILVATDVAARGLDISGVTHVYNYDIPQDRKLRSPYRTYRPCRKRRYVCDFRYTK